MLSFPLPLFGSELFYQSLGDNTWAAGVSLDNVIGDLAVKWVALGHEAAQYLLRITFL
jgi:hypothetical protein